MQLAIIWLTTTSAAQPESLTSWIEAIGVSVEAVALIFIFGLDFFERRDSRKEREEQRKAHEEERQERLELRKERQRLEGDRQRSNVTCLGVRVFAETMNEERLCDDLWKLHTNKQAGFAIQKHLHNQLPEYLLRVSASFDEEIRRATMGGNRYWLVFKFPFRQFGVVLSDLRILSFGEMLVAWDENGKAIRIDA